MDISDIIKNPQELEKVFKYGLSKKDAALLFKLAPYIENPRLLLNYVELFPELSNPEIERIILRDPYSAYFYALYFKKGRWPEAEPYIMKDPLFASKYAREIMKERWLEAEPYIQQNEFLWEKYKTHFGLL